MKKRRKQIAILLSIIGIISSVFLGREIIYGDISRENFVITNTIIDQTFSNSKSEIQYSKASYYFVEIPKTIYIREKEAEIPYEITLCGDLASDKIVKVIPIDKVPYADGINVYLEDRSNQEKESVVLSVFQSDCVWNWRECLGNGTTKTGYLQIPEMSAGNWGGSLEFMIEFRDRK